jgi:hypothetical protein
MDTSSRGVTMAWTTSKDGTLPSKSQIHVSSTTDGATWTEDVLDMPAMALQPTISAQGNRAALVWYDFRDNVPAAGTALASVWSAVRTDQGWVQRQLTAAQDVSRTRGVSLQGSGYWLGDFGALTPTRGGWLAAWSLVPTDTSRALDVYALRISAP